MTQAREFGADAYPAPERAEIAPEPAPQLAQAVPTPAAAPEPSSGVDLLAELQAEAHRELANTVRIVVPSRPGWIMEFETLIGQGEVKEYRRKSTRGKGKHEQTDEVYLSALALVSKNVGIYRDDNGTHTQVLDPDGDPLTLTSDAWLGMYPELSRDSINTLRRFASDSSVLAMGGTLMESAGWGETAATVDPTNG